MPAAPHEQNSDENVSQPKKKLGGNGRGAWKDPACVKRNTINL